MAREAELEDLERGDRIRQLRERKGVSQEDAASELSVTTRAYWQWEHGGQIKPDNLKRLAEYYAVERDYIVRGETPEPLEAISESEARELRKQLDRIEEKLDKLLKPPTAPRRRPPPKPRQRKQ